MISIFKFPDFLVSTEHVDAAVLELDCTGLIIVIVALLKVLGFGFVSTCPLLFAATLDVTSSLTSVENQIKFTHIYIYIYIYISVHTAVPLSGVVFARVHPQIRTAGTKLSTVREIRNVVEV